jgi:hypothetical protein
VGTDGSDGDHADPSRRRRRRRRRRRGTVTAESARWPKPHRQGMTTA